jgi:hypothetical protein
MKRDDFWFHVLVIALGSLPIALMIYFFIIYEHA